MTSTTWDNAETAVFVNTPTPTATAARKRVRGLRLSTVPSWPLLAQLAGGASALGGVYLQFGTGITMIVGGVLAAGLGMLREGGKI
jgi:hypothetical protein